MRGKIRLVMAGLLASGLATLPVTGQAVTQDNFQARTTGDLVATCSAGSNDPMRVAAIHFCDGFILGAYQYHQAEEAGPKGSRMFCVPNNNLTIDQAVVMFVRWAQANPQYSNERPVDSLARFAHDTWPCGRR